MRADQARSIPISTYLSRAGIKPAKVLKDGRELWYQSPLRDKDRTPSFKVSVDKNLWFDHGLARGGNIIDLVIEMRQVTVKEALAILSGGFSGEVPMAPLYRTESAGEKERLPSLELVSVQAIRHGALREYLQLRAIPLNLANSYLVQVNYRRRGQNSVFFALGFANGGGYEARSPLFKGFIGKGKTVSALNFADKGTVAVFEGVFDFLSWLAHRNLEEPDCGVVILNSVSLRRKAIEIIVEHGFGRILLYLDRDDAGRETVRQFQEALGNRNVVDGSMLFDGHKDVNEWWVKHSKLTGL